VANPTLNILVGVQMGGLRFKNHTHKNQMLNSSKGALKSICYCLSIYITERFKNYCGPGNKLTLNISRRGSKLPLNQISHCHCEARKSKTLHYDLKQMHPLMHQLHLFQDYPFPTLVEKLLLLICFDSFLLLLKD
jgi:hypothetical protein